MTKQDAIELLRELSNFVATPPETDEAVNMAIEALSENKRTDKHTETHACDCISRQAAIDCEYQVKIINDIEYVMLSEVQMKMRKLPSAQPFTEEEIQTMQELEAAQVEKAYELGKADRPTGHWIDTQVDSAGLAHRRVCSICGEEPAAWSSVNKFDFCPNCGADMRDGEEE